MKRLELPLYTEFLSIGTGGTVREPRVRDTEGSGRTERSLHYRQFKVTVTRIILILIT